MALKKYALITGCSDGGIGAALAHEFAARGVHVFATARTPAKMASLETVPDVTLLTMDVTSQSSIAAAVAVVSEHTGGTLDYLVNNAGNQVVSPVLDLDIDLARQMFDVNVWGVFAVTKAFAPLVIAVKGTIANLASLAVLLSPPYLVTYASSKAACEVFSEGLRRELAPFGVRVATVVTGAIKTNLHSNSPDLDLPPGSLYTPVAKQISNRATGRDVAGRRSNPEDFARSLVQDLMNGASGKVYRGSMSTLIDVITRYFPSWMVDRLAVMGTGLDTVLKS